MTQQRPKNVSFFQSVQNTPTPPTLRITIGNSPPSEICFIRIRIRQEVELITKVLFLKGLGV